MSLFEVMFTTLKRLLVREFALIFWWLRPCEEGDSLSV